MTEKRKMPRRSTKAKMRKMQEIEVPTQSTHPKYALVLSYLGSQFAGIQFQNFPVNVCTVMGVLLDVLHQLDAIDTPDSYVVGIHCTSRTDKGVHALRNLLCLRMDFEDMNALCDKVNIEVSRFNLIVQNIVRVPDSFNAVTSCLGRVYLYLIPRRVLPERDDITQVCNQILGVYNGVHSFHNFTDSGDRASFLREMHKIALDDENPVISMNSEEYLVVKLDGKGFMKHQIRRMIGLMMYVLTHDLSEQTILQALDPAIDVKLPMAPGEYLILDSFDYSVYDSEIDSDSCFSPLSHMEHGHAQMTEFKQKIFEHIHFLDKENGERGRMSGFKFSLQFNSRICKFERRETPIVNVPKPPTDDE